MLVNCLYILQQATLLTITGSIQVLLRSRHIDWAKNSWKQWGIAILFSGGQGKDEINILPASSLWEFVSEIDSDRMALVERRHPLGQNIQIDSRWRGVGIILINLILSININFVMNHSSGFKDVQWLQTHQYLTLLFLMLSFLLVPELVYLQRSWCFTICLFIFDLIFLRKR